MSLVNEVADGLDGLAQVRALMASERKPGMLLALDFEFVEIEPGRAAFAGTPGEHAYNPIGTVHSGDAATLLESNTAAQIEKCPWLSLPPRLRLSLL